MLMLMLTLACGPLLGLLLGLLLGSSLGLLLGLVLMLMLTLACGPLLGLLLGLLLGSVLELLLGLLLELLLALVAQSAHRASHFALRYLPQSRGVVYAGPPVVPSGIGTRGLTVCFGLTDDNLGGFLFIRWSAGVTSFGVLNACRKQSNVPSVRKIHLSFVLSLQLLLSAFPLCQAAFALVLVYLHVYWLLPGQPEPARAQ